RVERAGQPVEELSPGRSKVALGSFRLRRVDLPGVVPRSVPDWSAFRRNAWIDGARSTRPDAHGPGGSRRGGALALGLRRRFLHRDVGKVARGPASRRVGRHAQTLEDHVAVGWFAAGVGRYR